MKKLMKATVLDKKQIIEKLGKIEMVSSKPVQKFVDAYAKEIQPEYKEEKE